MPPCVILWSAGLRMCHSSAFARRLCAFGEVAPLLLTYLCGSLAHVFLYSGGSVSVVQFRNIAPTGLLLELYGGSLY